MKPLTHSQMALVIAAMTGAVASASFELKCNRGSLTVSGGRVTTINDISVLNDTGSLPYCQLDGLTSSYISCKPEEANLVETEFSSQI